MLSRHHQAWSTGSGLGRNEGSTQPRCLGGVGTPDGRNRVDRSSTQRSAMIDACRSDAHNGLSGSACRKFHVKHRGGPLICRHCARAPNRDSIPFPVRVQYSFSRREDVEHEGRHATDRSKWTGVQGHGISERREACGEWQPLPIPKSGPVRPGAVRGWTILIASAPAREHLESLGMCIPNRSNGRSRGDWPDGPAVVEMALGRSSDRHM
jgi:hypothetical protein